MSVDDATISLDAKTVLRIAFLARIAIPEDEITSVARRLSQVVDWFEALREVNTEGIEPMVSVAAAAIRWRDDKVTDGDQRNQVLANAHDVTADGFFTVPTVVQ